MSDVGAPPPSQRPTSLNLTKDEFDRHVDTIMSHFQSDSPRTKAQQKVWADASQSNNELRALLGDSWALRRDDAERAPTPAAKDPGLAFFPTDWSNCLNEETMAELILDAFTSTFVDSFLDGAISLVEVSNKWTAAESTVQQSSSEGSLQQPRANRRLRNTSHADKALLSMGLSDSEPVASDGFTMGGLTKDSFEAWNTRNFHKCKPLDPFLKRIEKATESQRPQRRNITRSESTPDHRKYQWPITKTHFPAAWDRASYRPRAQIADYTNAEPGDEPEDLPPDKWLLRVGRGGKTTFPYSLVSHRAFLESLPSPILKEKARKIAPLRLTSEW
jgi:hypothetical protein